MKNLTQSELKRYNAALIVVKTLENELSVVAKPLSSVDIKNIPNPVEPAIRNWIRNYRGRSEVYGSGAMATHSFHARKPQDLDIVIDNPKHAAYSLYNIIRGRGYKAKIVPNPEWGSYVVQVNVRGKFVDALDIHPIKDHYGKYDFYGASKQPLNKSGIILQRASDQLLRKANAITQRREDGSMGASSHREVKDVTDFINTAELLSASLKLKSNAQLIRAKSIKDNLKVWKTYLKTLKNYKKLGRRVPISKTRKEQFIRKVVKKPAVNVDNFIFEDNSIKVRKVSPKSVLGLGVIVSPYVKSPYKRKGRKTKRAGFIEEFFK